MAIKIIKLECQKSLPEQAEIKLFHLDPDHHLSLPSNTKYKYGDKFN